MRRFAELLDALTWQGQRSAKLRLIEDYLAHAPDPDRGYGLGALTGGLSFRHAKPALVRALVLERVDEALFGYSYDYVGDLAETVALIWPDALSCPAGEGRGERQEAARSWANPPALTPDLYSPVAAQRTPPAPAARERANDGPSLSEVVERLQGAGKAELPGLIAGWLDRLDATPRWALIKLMTGGLRVGVSARLAKTAFAQFGGLDASEVEEVWHAQTPPYAALFAWAERRAERPASAVPGGFRPVMLAQAVEEAELAALDPADYLAEWKWDGVRVQVVAEPGAVRLYSRAGEETSASFPDVVQAVDFEAVLDGELLVMRDGRAAPFADLQRRLNRKAPDAALLRDSPAGVRLYDLLSERGEDLRPLPFEARRLRLEAWVARRPRPRFDLSPLLPFRNWQDLAALRSAAREGVEGVMLKRRDSSYVGGRPRGPWFKWKRDPHLLDAVLMYAQRGHGKRSSFYSDYTFGLWRADGALAAIGKAYFGFTDEELALLDRWVREHTVARYGPVREVEKALVLEIAFEGAQASNRHRSGYALRFPRVRRIRWDKPAAEADALESLAKIADRPLP